MLFKGFFPDAETAMENLLTHQVDVVLMDINLLCQILLFLLHRKNFPPISYSLSSKSLSPRFR